MRLIDADKMNLLLGISDRDIYAKRMLDHMDTVDAVPVVRCKDCKHFNHKRMECENEAISTDHEGGAQYSLNFWPDDFCSYGEPKEGTNADDHD